MNKFLPVDGGHSLHLDEFVLMQGAYFDGFKALVYKLAPSGNTFLQGVVIDTTGANVVYTSGYIAMDGEIYKVNSNSFTKSANPADALYFKPIQTAISPSPVTYEDATTQNVHFQRNAILKYKDVSDTDGVLLSNMSYGGSVIEGSILPWYPPPGKNVSDYFDSTGLGINAATGYAICNGLNNTLNLTGLYLGQATNIPSAGSLAPELAGTTATVGSITGRNTVQLTQSNIPNYNLPVSLNDPGHRHNFDQGGDNKPDGAPNWGVVQTNNDSGGVDGHISTSTTGITVSVNSGGSNVATENRPATFNLYYIMRIR
jgi:hypothetical protein